MMKILKKLLVWGAVFCIAVAALTALRGWLQTCADAAEAASSAAYAAAVSEDDPLLAAFCDRYPERTVLLACGADISDDGLDDLVVISQDGDDISAIALVARPDGGCDETLPVPAPRENQRLRFYNVDGSGRQEVLITGEKDGQVGYAVYRLVDGTLRDLFGEGMANCC